MNNRLLLLPIAATALVVSGCQTHSRSSHEFVVSLTSATPVSFTGHLKVDGKVQAVSGTTPAEYTIPAHSLSCELVQGPENGLLTVEIRKGTHSDNLDLVAATGGPNTTVKGTLPSTTGWYWP